MRRLVAALLAGVVLGFVVGHLSAKPAEAQLVPHWPRVGESVTIPVKVYSHDPAFRAQAFQRVADAAAVWSAALPEIDLIVVGEARAEDCHYGYPMEPGYITVCMGDQLSPGTQTQSHTQGDWTYHLDAGRATSYSPLMSVYATCHELGHTLGLFHGTDGCMGGSICPSAREVAYIAQAMDHDDGFETVGPGSAVISGSNYCGSAPTATASPAPTGTPTASSTPTTAPTPTATSVQTPVKCPAGWRKQGRC